MAKKRRLSWTATGDFSKSKKYLRKLRTKKFQNELMKYAELGVKALANATPKDTGFTAESWYSEVVISEKNAIIYWKNSNIQTSGKTQQTYSVAILLDVGHGLKDGGYVKAQNYITPALKPVLKELNEAIEKEVRS